MIHPHTGEELELVPRTCPVPGFDLAIMDGVLWQGKPWLINSMHCIAADGVTKIADLIRYGNDPAQPAEARAPLKELRVFEDAKLYGKL